MGSFFATLKKELIYRLTIYKMSRDVIRAGIFEWIEGYYNRSSLPTSNQDNTALLVKREQYLRKSHRQHNRSVKIYAGVGLTDPRMLHLIRLD